MFRRSALRLFALIATLAASARLPAGETEAPAGSGPAEKPPVRALSPALAEALSASLPAYRPPAAKDPAETDDEANDRLISLPKPRNGIVRLPRVVVEGKRPPVFREQDIYTAKGLAEIAVKRYFTETGLALNRFTLPLVGMGKEAYALLLWQQDERLRLLREFNEEADWSEAFGDRERAEAIRDLLNDTLSHPPVFYNPGQSSLRDARGQ